MDRTPELSVLHTGHGKNTYGFHIVQIKLLYSVLLGTPNSVSLQYRKSRILPHILFSEHCATDTEFHCTSYSQSTVPFTQNSTAQLILRVLWHLHRIPLCIIFSEYSTIYTEFHCTSYSQSAVAFTQNSTAHNILRVQCHLHRISLHILFSEHCAIYTEFLCTSYSQSIVPCTQNSTAHTDT